MTPINMIKHGLNARMVLVLEMLEKGDQTATSMASDMLSRVSITAISDKLFAKQLITRCRGKKDRREVIMSITDKGRNILK